MTRRLRGDFIFVQPNLRDPRPLSGFTHRNLGWTAAEPRGGQSRSPVDRCYRWTRARLNEVIRGKRGVTADAALDLLEALGTSSKVWMNLQATWDLDQAVKRRRRAA
jgi:antitoxin HigA-1